MQLTGEAKYSLVPKVLVGTEALEGDHSHVQFNSCVITHILDHVPINSNQYRSLLNSC